MANRASKDSILEIINTTKKEHKTTSLDVDKLFDKTIEAPHYLKNKTTTDLFTDVREALQEISHLDTSTVETYTQKLKGFVPIDDINTLIPMRYLRWTYRYNEEDTRLKSGIFLKMIMRNNGINLQLKTIHKQLSFYEIKLDECLIFMKLSEQENLMVIAQDLEQES
jgi:hypothetical protein